jgi:hypothetical protein
MAARWIGFRFRVDNESLLHAGARNVRAYLSLPFCLTDEYL